MSTPQCAGPSVLKAASTPLESLISHFPAGQQGFRRVKHEGNRERTIVNADVLGKVTPGAAICLLPGENALAARIAVSL